MKLPATRTEFCHNKARITFHLRGFSYLKCHSSYPFWKKLQDLHECGMGCKNRTVRKHPEKGLIVPNLQLRYACINQFSIEVIYLPFTRHLVKLFIVNFQVIT